MNKGLIVALAFIFGAGTGAAVTYKIIKDKYAKIAEDEISEMREYYNQKTAQEEELASKDKIAKSNRDKGDIMDYAKKITEERYSIKPVEEAAEEEDSTGGFIEYIDDDEFGEEDEYDLITLTYYSDGVLADEDDEEVEDFIEKVGNFTTHFGNSDVVYVRNDDYKAYYEIIRDERSYAEVTGEGLED